jgi:hypothetical protein
MGWFDTGAYNFNSPRRSDMADAIAKEPKLLQ